MTPPNNVPAERHLLGVLLRDALPFPADLKPSDFFEPKHQEVAAAILGLQVDGSPADELTVTDYLRRMGSSIGPSDIGDLTAYAGFSPYRPEHVELIADTAILRDATLVASKATDPDTLLDHYARLADKRKGSKVKHGQSIAENMARDKNRVRQTILAQDAGGRDIVNEDNHKTPPKGSYMVTNVKRGSPMAQKMEEAITHAKYWSAGRTPEELSKEELAEGPVGHFDEKGKHIKPENAHYGHTTLNGKRYDYQKQHILHPRLVNVPERRKNKETGEMEDVEHMIPTDSRFKDEEFLPEKRFKTKSGKNAGPILMTTPTESTSRVGHHTSFTHDVNEHDIEHAIKNNGEYQIDPPHKQEAAAGKEYAAPQAIKIVRKAKGGSVELGEEDFYGLGDDDFFAFPESNHAAQHHLAHREESVTGNTAPKAKPVTLQQFKAQRVLRKAVGGPVNLSNVGVNEAPDMDIKAYFPPSPITKRGELPAGGIPQPPAPQQQPGMPPPGAPPGAEAPQGPGQPPAAPQMGGLPSAPPQGPPMGQPPSNILQMTRQGQAMNAMTPPQ